MLETSLRYTVFWDLFSGQKVEQLGIPIGPALPLSAVCAPELAAKPAVELMATQDPPAPPALTSRELVTTSAPASVEAAMKPVAEAS